MNAGAEDRLNRALEGRYRVERELGHGGMAVVYLAHDLKHARPVAIKVLSSEFAEALGAERFAREIEIAAGLNHPNILALHDSGEADGLHYFVMPFVEGESLRDRLDREGTLDVDVATRIVREIGGALAYAHERGLVHRDIKPANILFQAGQAVVCDFGIAQTVHAAQDRLTKTGLSLGTLAYMSPEQLAGDVLVDGRADTYALGCMLHEMLYGDVPFSGASAQATMAKKLIGELPDAPLGAAVPATVHDVIRRALAVVPEARFATSTEFISTLDHATTQIAIDRDFRRRRRARGLVGLGVAVGVAALSVGGWWLAYTLGGPSFERVAVLPFTSSAANPALDYFLHGIHEDLLREFQRAGIRVINPSSVRRYAGSDAALQTIARELGVDAIIQGSAELVGRRVGLELLLVDAASDLLVWTESFQADERDIVGLLRDVTRIVAEEIGLDLSPQAERRLAEAPQVDEILYEALLQARFETFKLTPEGLDQAEGYYRLALARDSLAVDAWVGLAQVWNVRAQQGLISQQEAQEHTGPALARAGAIDPDLGEDHAAKALRLTWPEWPAGRWDEAEEAFYKALERDPTDSVTRAYFALLLLYRGRTEEGAAESERAAMQAPDDALVQGLHGQALNALGRAREAEASMTRARRFVPDAPILLSTLRTTYHLLGEYERAMELWRDSYTASGDLEALDALQRGYSAGGYESALRSVAELFIERSKTQRVTPWQIGTLYTRAGMPEEAIRYLEEAVAEGDPNSPYLTVDGIFDPLRDSPRFQALVDRFGRSD